jgi:tRNA pseudouridine38-40 synthase
VPRTLKLTIAYDGTDFAGWQRQATERTVQAAIEDALLPIDGERVIVTGAGRTDAGVHAAGQVASIRLRSSIANEILLRALNATLPADVRVLAIDDAPEGFNAQFAAKRKTYRYSLWSDGVVPPALRRYVWHIPQRLSVAAMDEAAAVLIGTHDFSAFQASGGDVQTTVRGVLTSRIETMTPNAATGDGLLAGAVAVPVAMLSGRLICYEITGAGFLRHMVRNIVGTLVDIGRDRLAVGEMRAVLESRDRARASATAPSHGLTLWSVDY